MGAVSEVAVQPHEMSAVELLAAFAARTLSPVEAMRDVLARVEQFEPHIHATYLCAPERALSEARASETRWQRGEPIGLLDGVPVTIKDNIATKGEPTPLGSSATRLVPASADAPPAARLREAGAICFAKTTMPDYGMLSSGLSSFHKLTRNPWDLTKNPGGSSAGAGAAAAAQYGPLHLGTDIGGSVRLPASWCGIFGLKPSAGRVPIDPPFWGRVAGPMTRTVRDAALMMAAMARPDHRDFMSLPPLEIDWHITQTPLRGLRIGVLMEAGCGASPTPPVQAAVARVVTDLEDAGASVHPVAPFLTQQMLDGLDRFWRMRALLDLRALAAGQRRKVLPFIETWAQSAAEFSGEQIFHGSNQILAMRQAAVTASQPYDFVISPTAPMTTYAAGLASPSDDPLRPFPHIGFTVAFNMSGQPAATLNCGYDERGLPIGLQIIGQRFDDVGVLGLAMSLEAMLASTRRPWPQPPAG